MSLSFLESVSSEGLSPSMCFVKSESFEVICRERVEKVGSVRKVLWFSEM